MGSGVHRGGGGGGNGHSRLAGRACGLPPARRDGLRQRRRERPHGHRLHGRHHGRRFAEPHDHRFRALVVGLARREQAPERPAVAQGRPRRVERHDDGGCDDRIAPGEEEHVKRPVVEHGVLPDAALVDRRLAWDVFGRAGLYADGDHAVSGPRVVGLLALAVGIPATGVGQAVRAAGAPGTYQVVAVRAPVSLPADRNVAFQVLPDGTAPVLGRLHGEFAAGGGADRVVVLTVGVPAAARAGRQEVARVRFSGAAGSAIEVPVEVDVARVRRASLVVAQALFATRVGGRVALRYRLTNTGNAGDSFSVRATGPARWPAGPARGDVLQARTPAGAEVTLTVPRGASTGSSSVQFVVSNGAGEMTRARAAVEVVDDGPRRGEQAGLGTARGATGLGGTAPARPGFGLDLEGPVANPGRPYGHLGPR